MIPFCIPKKLQQITSWHQLHYYVYRIIIHTHTKHFHNVGVVKLAKI